MEPLSQDKIDAIVAMPVESLQKISEGGFGVTYKLNFEGKAYLRKDIRFYDSFTKWSYHTEVKYLKHASSHPAYTFVQSTPYFYGSAIKGEFGYIVEEVLYGTTLDTVLDKRFLTEEEADFIIQTLDYYTSHVFHRLLKTLHLDIKPENIFLRMHHNKIIQVVLLDLGISRTVGEYGIPSGTAAYLHENTLKAMRAQAPIVHTSDLNIHALRRTVNFIYGAVAPEAAIEMLFPDALTPRPWEHDVTTSLTNALCFATLLDSKTFISYLLKIPEVNINGVSSEGKTALTVAKENGDPEMVTYLMEHGAQKGGRSSSGKRTTRRRNSSKRTTRRHI
jgi:serine/threonine protein kinase